MIFFLEKYKLYISPIADTYCYCLMPNHFHLLIKIKSEEELSETYKDLRGFKNLEGLLSNQFSRFLNSYAKAVNKEQNRKGSLFMKNFKRDVITNERHLNKIVHYIHYNPVEAGLCEKPKDWSYSSYNALISMNKSTMLLRDEVISWFGDRDNFIYCHLN